MDLPEPMTRRVFLHRGLTLVGAGSTVPAFLAHSALSASPAEGARTRSRPGVPEDHVLVVIQLAGGNDGLNTVVPVGNDDYYKARPQLAIDGKAALRIDDDYGLHPSLAGLKSLHDQGLLGIVQGIGYPNPNRSHFKSMDIWHTASPDGREHAGWIGRYFDSSCRGEDGCDPKRGISLMGEVPPAMRGDKFLPVAFRRPEDLSWRGDATRGAGRGRRMNRRGAGQTGRMGPDHAELMTEAFERLNSPAGRRGSPLPEVSYLQRTAMDARISAEIIQQAAAGQAAVTYPTSPLAGTLNSVARMIASGLPTRIYYVSQGGFDTHSGQTGRHAQLLTQFGDALKAFVDDLAAIGQLGRVVVMTFSEFGRRVSENASGGTDHGEAAPMFVVGPSVSPGFHGEAPSLARDDLHRGDLAWTTDFRRVYAAVLSEWLGADAKAILGDGLEPLNVFKQV